MDRERELALIDRIMAHRAAGDATDLAPEMYANSIDTYVDPARYQREVEQIFRSVPLSACVAEGRGNAAHSLMCRFHGWSYRLDGRLINPTHRQGFAGLDRSERGLSELACDEVAGLVFVQLHGAPGSLDAARWLAGLAPELEEFGFADYCFIDSRASTWAVNWKLMFDTFCETYHVRHLHHASIAPQPPTTEGSRRRWDKAFELLLDVIGTEDYIMSEQTQRSFRSGAQQEITFGRNEPALIHFHRSIEEMLERPTPNGAAFGEVPVAIGS